MALAEQEVLPKAAHVFFTSQPLMDRKAAGARNALLVGNGVNYEPFARFRVQREERRGRPVAGYLGNLSDFFDWELMQAVCAAMPEVDFVFHGQIETGKLGGRLAIQQAMARMSNVTFTGRVTRGVGAAAVARYDVLLIPFVVNDAMHAVNPLKLWEYFATGCPVVSTPMKAVHEVAPILLVADGAAAWVEAINQALTGEAAGAHAIEARIGLAELHRWDQLTRQHAQAIRQAMPHATSGKRLASVS